MIMAKTFEQTFIEELRRVPWLAGHDGEAIVGALGAQQDIELRALKDAVLMRCPLEAPSDALSLLALDRMLLRAPPESNADFVLRLDRAHDIWEQGGTSKGIVELFKPYGFTSATVQFLRNCEVGGAWDGNEAWFSRAYGLVDSRDGYWDYDGEWEEDPGSDVWSEDENAETWDSTATVPDLRYLRAATRLLKSPDSYPVTIAVWLSTHQMPDGYWDSPGGLWPEDEPDANGAEWCEDESCHPLYWTLGHVWGEEAWTGDGVDTWVEDEEIEMVDIAECDQWVAFAEEA